jgi:hypothetical protein
MTLDISNFYLMTPLKQPEYVRVKIDDIPEELINKYKLREIANKRAWFVSRSQRECMDYPRQDSSQMNYLSNASTNTDISRANWCLAYGNTQHDQYRSHSLLTTLA